MRIRDFITEYGHGAIYPVTAIISLVYHPKLYRNPHPKGTIILVFCWFTPNIAHNVWVNYLEREGFRTYLVHLPLLFEDFAASAGRLKQFILRHNIKKYTLVGLSTGAVVCLFFLDEFKKWHDVNRFISVGGPLHGTPYAKFISFCGKGRDLLPGSAFLKQLGKIVVPLGKMATISVVYDELIPRKSNKWKGAVSYVIPGWGHNSFHLTRSEAYELIAGFARAK